MREVKDYSFGRIVIGDDVYTQDVIIFPERVRTSWWRKEGHVVSLEDIREVIEYKPEVIIIGTGAYGRVTVQEDVKAKAKDMGIELIICPTSDAVKKYNEIRTLKRTVACLHLTC